MPDKYVAGSIESFPRKRPSFSPFPLDLAPSMGSGPAPISTARAEPVQRAKFKHSLINILRNAPLNHLKEQMYIDKSDNDHAGNHFSFSWYLLCISSVTVSCDRFTIRRIKILDISFPYLSYVVLYLEICWFLVFFFSFHLFLTTCNPFTILCILSFQYIFPVCIWTQLIRSLTNILTPVSLVPAFFQS